MTHRHTGAFLQELTRYFNSVAFLQTVEQTTCHKTLNDFELNETRVEAVAVEVSGPGVVRKACSYAKRMPLIWHEIRRADYLYLFVPGTLSLLVSTCARFARKSYGIYLRGERGMNGRTTRWALSGADFIHANGAVLADRARRLCNDVELTVPMVDLTLKDCIKSRVFRDRPPWEILYVGRMEGGKGVVELVEAAKILKKRGIDFHLSMIGDGAKLEAIRAEAEQGLDTCIRCLGLISDRERLFSLYRAADLLVLPSHDEGFPRVLYEAMAFQTPIITTFVGSISSLMKDKVNCLRVGVGNPVELASTMERVMADVGLRRKIAGNGSGTIRQLLESNRGNSHARQVWERVAKHAKAQ